MEVHTLIFTVPDNSGFYHFQLQKAVNGARRPGSTIHELCLDYESYM